MYDLKGKSAIITGGANGIGRKIGLRLAEEGCDIGIFDINEAEAQKTAADIRAKGRHAHVEKGSVADKDDVERGMTALTQQLGKVDILVNNAGILRVGKLLTMNEKDWSDSFRVNVDSVFWVSRAVIPHMVARNSGCVLNLASWLGKKGIASYGLLREQVRRHRPDTDHGCRTRRIWDPGECARAGADRRYEDANGIRGHASRAGLATGGRPGKIHTSGPRGLSRRCCPAGGLSRIG